MEPSPAATPFLLLFRNSGPETHAHLSPAERQQLVTLWNAWYDGLAASGKATEGQPLELETRLVSGPGGARVVDRSASRPRVERASDARAGRSDLARRAARRALVPREELALPRRGSAARGLRDLRGHRPDQRQ